MQMRVREGRVREMGFKKEKENGGFERKCEEKSGLFGETGLSARSKSNMVWSGQNTERDESEKQTRGEERMRKLQCVEERERETKREKT